MSDNILQAIDAIVGAISNKDCCCPGAGVGGTTGGQILDSDPPPDLGDPATDPPPTGFPDWPTYDTYKCKASNFVFEVVYETMVWVRNIETAAAGVGIGAAFGTWLMSNMGFWMTSYSLTYAGGAGLVGVILTSAPVWILEAIAVLLVALVVAAVGLGVLIYFQTVADALDKDAIVCALYNAQNVSEARTALSDAIADAVASITINPPYNVIESLIRETISGVIEHLLTNEFLGVLFTDSDYVNAYTPTGAVDCSTCGGCALQIVHGSGTGSGAGYQDVDAVYISGGSYYRVQVDFKDGENYCSKTITSITLLSGGPMVPQGSWPGVAHLVDASGVIHHFNTLGEVSNEPDIKLLWTDSQNSYSIRINYA